MEADRKCHANDNSNTNNNANNNSNTTKVRPQRGGRAGDREGRG